MKMQTQAVPRIVRDGGGHGVKLYAGPRTEPAPEVIERLLSVSRLPWVAEPVVALPDVHWKNRLETPSSTAIATRSDIVLSFSSPSQNCGMNLIATPLAEGDLSERLLDGLMHALRDRIPRHRRRPELDRRNVMELCRKGAPAAAGRYGIDPQQCTRMELGGNALAGEEPSIEEIESVSDAKTIQAGRLSFAFIGGGNHFLEIQVVEEVLDRAGARAMGLEPGRVVVMFHTGSERLGHDLGRLYSWRRKTDPGRRRKLFWRKVRLHLMRDVKSLGDLRRRWNYHFRKQDYTAVPAASREGERLLLTLKMAANYGYANRIAVTGLIQEAFRLATGRRDMQLDLLADLSHNTIHREAIDGKSLWVHRHNAARAVGPSGLPEDHPYRSIGQPVMVPGTNRTSSFVVIGRDASAASLHSVDHGAGQTVDRFLAAGLLSEVKGRVTRKYGYRSSQVETLPHLSDEGIQEVMSVIDASGVARPAARMRPVAVLKA